MVGVHQLRLAALAAIGVLAHGAALAQSSTIARWVQYAPGTSGTAGVESWGNAPSSLTNTILVRAVVTNAASCPAAMLDHHTPLVLNQRFIGSQLTSTPGGGSTATNARAGYPQYFVSAGAPSAGTFPDGTQKATTSWGECEAVVPAGHKVVTVDGVDLKLPVAKPRRILVMADTGCRLNGALIGDGANQQNCHSPSAFPLSYLAPYEASFKPDVVLQVGDWFYRDTNCTGTNVSGTGTEPFAGCNTPTSANYEVWGDTFDSWNADVFYPMQPLLAAAPFIMARGNHESCGRGARGWFALLDAYPYNYSNVVCRLTLTYPNPGATTATYNGDFEPSYVVPLGGVNFIVHDSSFANDSAVDTHMAANYDIDISNLLTKLGNSTPVVFATHKPVFGLSYNTKLAGTGTCATGPGAASDESGNWTEQGVFNGGTGYSGTSFAQGMPGNIGLLLSGHVHQFQYLNTGSGAALNAMFAPQMIVGTGGTLLDPDCNTGAVPNGVTDVASFSQHAEPYVVQTDPGATTSTSSTTFSHDEFGFAVFDAIVDATNGNTIGYNADIYKVSSARAGVCKILFANAATNTKRSITCHL
jgi:hypothetical protein